MKSYNYTKNFWNKVNKKGTDDCWEWSGSCSCWGYGILIIKTRPMRAHRVSWEIHNGPIPADLCVLHKCDNRKCVNPNHLWLGTNEENTQDRHKKHRDYSPKGELNVFCKLTEQQVVQIKKLLDNGVPNVQIASKFNISQQNICNIKKGRSWRHV